MSAPSCGADGLLCPDLLGSPSVIEKDVPSVLKQRSLLRRRDVLITGAATLILGGCDRLSRAPSFKQFLASAEGLTYRTQRSLIRGRAMAAEFSAADVAKTFRPNGSQERYNLPPEYLELAQDN